MHETKEGVLNVTLRPDGSGGDGATDENLIKIEFAFECAITGAFYDAEICFSEMCSICPLFYAVGEIGDTLGEKPMITVDAPMVTAHWVAHGKTRKYLVDIPMKRREYSCEQRDTIELRAENKILQRRVLKLENQINQIAEMLIGSCEYQHKYSAGDGNALLLAMMKSPVEQLRVSFSIWDSIVYYRTQDISAIIGLNLDLRTFPPQPSTVCVLGKQIYNHHICEHGRNGGHCGHEGKDNYDARGMIRTLVEMHADVNHVHEINLSEKWAGWVCESCGYKSDGSAIVHRETPLSVIRAKIAINKDADRVMRESLHEIEQLLIAAGAK